MNAEEIKTAPRRNANAVASLVVGAIPTIFLVLAFADKSPKWLPETAVIVLPLLPLYAILLGHAGVRAANRSGGLVGGKAIARIGLILGYLFWPILLVVPHHHPISEGNQTKGINNCKQIILTLKLYADDYNNLYPDAELPNAKTANEAFRRLFKQRLLSSEMIFGCPCSELGQPDGNVGTAPDYIEAVKPGENHWAMTKGLIDSVDSGSIPLVYENPSEATWPPKWNPSLMGTDKPGRPWARGFVIVGFNDGTVEALPLESTTGTSVGLKPRADGTPIFPILPDRKFEVLNAAR